MDYGFLTVYGLRLFGVFSVRNLAVFGQIWLNFRFKKVIYYSPPIKSSTVNEMDMNLGVESILSYLLEDHLAPSVVRLAPCPPRK